MRNKVITILFCLLLISGIGISAFMPDKYYSENEKRTLKQFPIISWTDIRSGKFGDEIEKYLADQFPGRDGWVTVKTIVERASGKKESGGVYFAKDSYLIEAFTGYKEKQCFTNIMAIRELSDALYKEGVTLDVMLVPTASCILSDKLPTYAPNSDQGKIIEYAKKQGLNVVEVENALKKHKTEYIFYKTDHHWTSLGAYYAYAEWISKKSGQAAPISEWKTEILCDNFRGTTYAKVNDPFAPYDTITAYYRNQKHEVNYNNGDYITDSIYERKYLNGSDQYAVFLNSNQSITVVNGGGTGKLLILKDSYANCFAQFTVDDYAETHLIDLRFFKGSVQEYVKEHGITEVLVLYNIPNFIQDTGISRCNQ